MRQYSLRFSRLRTLAIVQVCTLGLVACAGSGVKPPHEPIKLDLTIAATSTVNPDDQKRPSPIIVRVFELKNADAFNDADFFTLYNKEKIMLGDDIAAKDQFQLRPGDQKTILREADQATTTLGVIAAYRDLPNSVWRGTWDMPFSPSAAWYHFFGGPKLTLTITLDANEIRIFDGQSKNK